MNDSLPIIVIAVPVACAVGYWFWSLYWRSRQRGGMAGVLVGADIERTVDRVDAYSQGMSSGEMRVHQFAQAPADRVVGLELVLRTSLSYDAMTAGLSSAQARELAWLIRRGLGENPPYPAPRRRVRDGPV